MKKRIAARIAAPVLALGLVAGNAGIAHAAETTACHRNLSNSKNTYIIVLRSTTDGGGQANLYKGQCTNQFGWNDAQRVYVRAGEEIRFYQLFSYGWQLHKVADSTGYHTIALYDNDGWAHMAVFND